jgi:hypothetical protein
LAHIRYEIAKVVYDYTLEYTLVADEPFVRMRATGSCPHGYSTMTQFTLSAPIGAIAQGTTYHWDDTPQVRYWHGPSMQATHDFLIPRDKEGAPLCAIFHGSMPAWGQDDGGDSLLVGGLARNPGGNYFAGWSPCPPGGIDPDTHTLDYAFRVPGTTSTQAGSVDPRTGEPLKEALSYNTPLMAAVIPADAAKLLPESISLASVHDLAGTCAPIITAVKPAEQDPSSFIFRVYQPSNAGVNAVLSLKGLQGISDASVQRAEMVTALEQPAVPTFVGTTELPSLPVVEDGKVLFVAERALTTLKIS